MSNPIPHFPIAILYPLKGLATTRAPQTTSALKNWLDKSGKDWDGKIYIATSIFLKNAEFRQSGCSPNYMAGWWSLKPEFSKKAAAFVLSLK
jgi:hypothetical protein